MNYINNEFPEILKEHTIDQNLYEKLHQQDIREENQMIFEKGEDNGL